MLTKGPIFLISSFLVTDFSSSTWKKSRTSIIHRKVCSEWCAADDLSGLVSEADVVRYERVAGSLYSHQRRQGT